MMSGARVIFTFLLISLAVQTSQGAFYDDEKSLRNATLTGYEYKIRPEASVTCDVRLSLLNINILDVTGQRLSVSGWLTVVWNDTRLVWTPSTYGHIEDFYDTELVLWRPELIVDNEIANLDILQSDKLLIRATYLGVMTWEPPGIFETHCDVDVTFYPFDTQLCIIQVTSWGYTVNEVNLQARDTAIYLEDFQESGEWEILDNWSERRLLLDGTEYHSQVDFHMKLRRRPIYYVMTVLIPVIVTSILCILVFLLPVESGEKVGYTLTILLTYVVMLTLVAGYMPPTSKTTSLLSIYLTIVLFLGVFATLATVFTLFFYHHDNEEPVPEWMVKVWTKALIPVANWKKPAASSSASSDPEVANLYVTKDHGGNRIHPTGSGSETKDKSKSSLEREPTVVNSWVETDVSLNWQDVSVIMDAALFKVLTIFIVFLTVIVLLGLIIGGYS